MKNVRVGLISKKEEFLKKLENSEINPNIIVFIQDTKEI